MVIALFVLFQTRFLKNLTFFHVLILVCIFMHFILSTSSIHYGMLAHLYKSVQFR